MSLFLCCSLLCAHNIMCTCLHIIILAPSPYIFHSKGRCYCGNKQAAQLKLWAEVSFECSFYHLNPEGPQVNGGPHALRMILSLITPKTWPASKGRLESKRTCPRHFLIPSPPIFWIQAFVHYKIWVAKELGWGQPYRLPWGQARHRKGTGRFLQSARAQVLFCFTLKANSNYGKVDVNIFLSMVRKPIRRCRAK